LFYVKNHPIENLACASQGPPAISGLWGQENQDALLLGLKHSGAIHVPHELIRQAGQPEGGSWSLSFRALAHQRIQWGVPTIVRELKESDKSAWLVLWKGYQDFYKVDLRPEQTELTWKGFFNPKIESFALVAESESGPIGLAHYSFQSSTWAEAGYCYLEDLFVDPVARGAGAGGALLDAVKAKALAAKSVRLYWNTDATNTVARFLYDRYVKESGKVQYRMPLEGLSAG
jgi:GNAT superfamily N-acetyltransferase